MRKQRTHGSELGARSTDPRGVVELFTVVLHLLFIPSSSKVIPSRIFIPLPSPLLVMRRDEAITTIRFLSICLHEPPRGEQIPQARDKKEDRELSLFNHLSTMLNIGMTPGLVPAVTGQMTKDDVIATVVVSSDFNDDAQVASPYTVISITPSRISPQSLDNPSM